jgi:hypothetical protein
MTILYGFTKDQGFAMVDTDARSYLYGYPTSDLQRFARQAGARKACEARIAGLLDLSRFVLRCAALNPGKNVGQTEHGGYEQVLASIVAPQAFETVQS